MAYIEKQMISLCGKAVHGWRMIHNGDKVALGISGGKDSLSLLYLLNERRRRIPIDFEIVPMHIEMGYGNIDVPALERACEDMGLKLQVFNSDFGPRAHSEENRKNSPCFFCTLKRRTQLFLMCKDHGCNKLALAHHQDDIHETFMMNLMYSGKIATMLPVQPLFHGALTIIRPLSLATADMTRRFAALKELPVQPPCCPSSESTKRAEVGEMLDGLYRGNKKVRANLWHAMTHAGLASLPTPPPTMRLTRKKSDNKK